MAAKFSYTNPDNYMSYVKHLHLDKSMLPFDLNMTLSCGQIFGWKREGIVWTGIHNGKVIELEQNEEQIRYAGCTKAELIPFLGLNHDIREIESSIKGHILQYTGCEDSFFNKNFELAEGIRIIRQNPWECLISFICSANSNVPTIGKRISLLIERFGGEGGSSCHIFPDPKTLSVCTEEELRGCLTGYRAPYLKKTAHCICHDEKFFDRVAREPYPEAKKLLMTLPGVGPKVADCVLLFSFSRFEAVPIDVRIRRIITKQYLQGANGADTKEFTYDEIADFCREYFGPFAGYAQQYLFATRDIQEL